MMNTKHLGDISNAKVLSTLLSKGYPVLMPFGDNQRYDLVFERSGMFFRVQTKTGRLREGAIRFPTANQAGGGPRKNYVGEVDYFGVYCPETDKSYLVPVDGLGLREVSLRVEPARNNQTEGVRYAAGFQI